MSFIFDIRYEPPTDYNMSLYEIINLVSREMWIPPKHQRGAAWKSSKKSSWVKRLTSSVLPVGVIVTYQINDGKASPIFINDGMQRINATLEFLSNPKAFGYNEEEAESIIRGCKMPVQHRHYSSPDEAYLDFQRLNQGTALTGFEFYKGILAYMSDFETVWQPLFEKLHNCVDQCAARIASKYGSKSRSQIHKLYRHDFVLAFRFLTRDKSLKRFQVGKEDTTSDRLEKQDVVEWQLRLALEKIGIETARKDFEKLFATLERETALIEEVWSSVKGEQNIGRGMSTIMFRFLLEVAIWKRNNEVPNERWKDFLKKVLTLTKGSGSIANPEDTSDKYGLALSRLYVLRVVCQFTKSDLLEFSEERRNKREQKFARPGYDQSHLEPFSIAGDGPTIFEPAGINRARGAKPLHS